MSKFLSMFGYTVLAGVILTIVFVRSGELGGKNGGDQASAIINSSASGFAKVINALTGVSG